MGAAAVAAAAVEEGVMDLVKAWLAAIGVLVVTAVGTAVLAIATLSPDWLASTLGGAIWAGGVAFVTYGLTTVAAGLAHRVPRPDPVRGALAVLPVPALALVASLVVAVVRGGSLPAAAAETVLGAGGVVVGWVLVRTLRGRDGRRAGSAAEAAYRY